MNRLYTYLRSDFRRTIRRYEFTECNGLAVLAAAYKRVLSTIDVGIASHSPEKSLVSEYAYKGKENSPKRAVLWPMDKPKFKRSNARNDRNPRNSKRKSEQSPKRGF